MGGGFSLTHARTFGSGLRHLAAFAMLALAALGLAPAPAQMGPQLYPSQQSRLPKPPPASDPWANQDRLIAQSVARIPAAAVDQPNVYAIAIAPLARQTLFSREAKVALAAMAANFGGTAASGVLLSNLGADQAEAPLATRSNISDVLAGIGRRTQSSPDDIVMIYLTSHGAPDASLESALPKGLPILAITADSMAAALDQARIRRRVIVISACFAGSWIPRLANDDTIIITAAQADRTSFGCAEDRQLTYFGEAFLTGPFARGASLHESFEGAKKTVTEWETREKLLNSNPQAYVGKNMLALWDASPKAVTVADKRAAPAAAQASCTARCGEK
jgi:hypothetical protein